MHYSPANRCIDMRSTKITLDARLTQKISIRKSQREGCRPPNPIPLARRCRYLHYSVICTSKSFILSPISSKRRSLNPQAINIFLRTRLRALFVLGGFA